MNMDELDLFYEELRKIESKDEKKKFTNNYYQQMLKKYNNQFKNNEIVDEFLDAINRILHS